MPTYEYECKSCGYGFEVFQSMSDEALRECPECGREVRRLINGGSGIIFKGSGFYVTDKSSAAKSAAKSTESKKDIPCSSCAKGSDTASCPKKAAG